MLRKRRNCPGFVAQVRLQVGKFLVEDGEQFSQVRGAARDGAYACSVPPQRGWNLYRDRHFVLRLCAHRRLLRDLDRIQRFVQILFELGQLRRDGALDFINAREHIRRLQAVSSDAQTPSFLPAEFDPDGKVCPPCPRSRLQQSR